MTSTNYPWPPPRPGTHETQLDVSGPVIYVDGEPLKNSDGLYAGGATEMFAAAAKIVRLSGWQPAWPPPRPQDHESMIGVRSGPPITDGSYWVLSADGDIAGGRSEYHRAHNWALRELGY